MLRICQLIFIIASVLVHFNDGKINLRIKITDYQNVQNLMHNGVKCETYHWAGDHCDPMFDICVSSNRDHRCDIKNKFINFIANKKAVYFIWDETMELYNLPAFINIKVKVTDHDRYDAHDHIANFYKDFYITSPDFHSRNYMVVNPWGLNVHLAAEVMISCSRDFYGSKCEKYCVSKQHLYYCDKHTGEKVCIRNCGLHGQCVLKDYFRGEYSRCICSKEWFGLNCDIKVRTTSSSTITSTFKSSINTILVDPTTTKIRVTSTSIVFTTPKLNEATLAYTYLTPPTLKNTTSIESHNKTPKIKGFKYSMTSEHIENTRELSKNKNDNGVMEASHARLKQKEYSNNHGSKNHSNFNTSQILIIVAVFIVMCVIFLFGHRYIKLKYKYKYLNQSQVQRSLPQVVFTSNQNKQDCTLYTMADSEYDTCSIKTNFDDAVKDIKFQNDAIEEDDNFYEIPISKNRQM